MKIALVHDYIKEYGGAERVLEVLHGIFPEAPVYTLIYAPQFLGPHQERFKDWRIKPSFLQYIPCSYKFVSIFRLIAPFVFGLFNFKDYDVIIVSATGAYSVNMINKKSAKQICYCHTPPRYLYGFATAREWKKHLVFRILGEVANHFLRMVDYTASKHVDVFIANSQNIKKRIQKFYRRESVVIYPPVISSLVVSRLHQSVDPRDDKNEYYLTGGRLARPKHIDLIIQAFTEMKKPLKVFGKDFAGYGEELRQMAGNTIEFLGEIADEEKLNLMQHAKAFIIAAEDEDFGIIPVEAMSMGIPVIAYKSGGLMESVVDGKTGVFFEELTVDSLKSAVRKIDRLQISSKDCIKQAEKFGKQRFEREIRKIVG